MMQHCHFPTLIFVTLSCASLLQPASAAEDGVWDIGNKRPEGIHLLPEGAAETMGLDTNGTWVLVSEFLYGGIKALNLDTGNVTQVVNSTNFGERGTIGLWYENDMILAASGGVFGGLNTTPALLVFDAASGELLAECEPNVEGKFLNDVTVINGLAYATDSFQNSIMVVELESAQSGECVVMDIETPEEIFLGLREGDEEDVWSANGIWPYANGLLIAHETNGGIYYMDISDDNKVSEVIANGTLPFADGLCVDGDTLFVVQNPQDGPVTGWLLALKEDDSVFAAKLGTLMSQDYDNPTTCAISGDYIYTPNARFSIDIPAPGEDDPSTFTEKFHVVGVDRFDFSASGATPTPAPPGGNTTETSKASSFWGRSLGLALSLPLIMMSASLM